MEIVNSYFNKNKAKINQIFKSNSKDEQLPATQLFHFLQIVFQIQEIKFIKDAKNYFQEDQNNSNTEKVVERYYKTTQGGASKKFYLYRVNFSLQEILEYLAYWLNTDKKIVADYPALKREAQEKKREQQKKLEQKAIIDNPKEANIQEELKQSKILQNEFTGEEEKSAIYIQTYQKEIQKLQTMLVNTTIIPQQVEEISKKINTYKEKISQLQKMREENKNTAQIVRKEKRHANSPQKKLVTQVSKYKRQINFKTIFEYYAKQNHLTGLKASFQRIEHESQTINYQKLVFFLKEYDLFPEKQPLQKKLHNLYVRVCASTRDLFYTDFLQFIQKLPEIIIQQPGSIQTKKQIMMDKIYSKSQKNKVLYNPFHSLEKNDFRINSHEIKYSFKLKPIKGKIQQQVINELQSRKKMKQQEKVESNKDKEQKILKKLKKLMAIDPYHPEVVKNAELLLIQQRSESVMQSVAHLDNMQKFRDNKFDMKAQFGISNFDQDPMREMSQRYDISKRVEMIERLQSERMNNIMSNLIVREQAKIQKFSNSPKKRQASSKNN